MALLIICGYGIFTRKEHLGGILTMIITSQLIFLKAHLIRQSFLCQIYIGGLLHIKALMLQLISLSPILNYFLLVHSLPCCLARKRSLSQIQPVFHILHTNGNILQMVHKLGLTFLLLLLILHLMVL